MCLYGFCIARTMQSASNKHLIIQTLPSVLPAVHLRFSADVLLERPRYPDKSKNYISRDN